jgi:hypothetical protein
MIKFKVVNKIPRIMFRYKSMNTNEQLAYRYFPFPINPIGLFSNLKSIFISNQKLQKDELGILLSHDDVYREEDIILAVGVGSGISLIHNCKKDRGPRSFIGIDGSKDQIEIAEDNARLNEVDFSRFKLIEGFVGNPTNIYGTDNQKTTKNIDINQMDFDILELDCEGSEIEILQDLTARPRHIIVEMHPMYRDIDIVDFLEMMNSKRYMLANIYTVNGDVVIPEEIKMFFEYEKIQRMIDFKLPWGDGLLVLNFALQPK